jgi:hypothetical protein
MEIVAHGLWAAAAAITAKRATTARVSVGWTIWWAAFPDVLAFGPYVAGAAWLWLAGRLDASGGLERNCTALHLSPDSAERRSPRSAVGTERCSWALISEVSVAYYGFRWHSKGPICNACPAFTWQTLKFSGTGASAYWRWALRPLWLPHGVDREVPLRGMRQASLAARGPNGHLNVTPPQYSCGSLTDRRPSKAVLPHYRCDRLGGILASAHLVAGRRRRQISGPGQHVKRIAGCRLAVFQA